MRRSASGSIVIASFLSPVLTMRSIRSEEHTSELQSQSNLVCRLLLEKKKNKTHHFSYHKAGNVFPEERITHISAYTRPFNTKTSSPSSMNRLTSCTTELSQHHIDST